MNPQEPVKELNYVALTAIARDTIKEVTRQWLRENEEATLNGLEERDMATADCLEAVKTIAEWCTSIYGISLIQREIGDGLLKQS
jgi:hypothetical protein